MNLQLFAQERTEEATPKRLKEARERGQVFKSMELVSVFTLLAAYLALQVAGPHIWAALAEFSRRQWSALAVPDLTLIGVRELMGAVAMVVLVAAAPVLLASAVTGLLTNYLQVGFLFTLQPLMPDFSRVNPFSGFVRIFSRRSVVELFKALFKIVIVSLVAYTTVRSQMHQFARLHGLPMESVLAQVGAMVSSVMLRVGLAMLALALADYAYQRYEHRRNLMMTKQEVKQEHRETEGSPEVRSFIRRRQREMARKRMMADVPKADVVVTNPTHYAVALEYQASQMSAPRCVAKGAGHLAAKIREVAVAHEVPLVENPPLARSLYANVEVGDEVPAELYQAVAEVLAYVYQIKGGGTAS